MVIELQGTESMKLSNKVLKVRVSCFALELNVYLSLDNSALNFFELVFSVVKGNFIGTPVISASIESITFN